VTSGAGAMRPAGPVQRTDVVRRAGQPVAWVTGLVGAGLLLRVAASGELASPPLSVEGLTTWADGREPVAAALALARLAAEVSVWYVLGLSALHVAARLVPVPGGQRLADALALPAARRLVGAGLGFGIVAASAVPVHDRPVAAPGAPGVATMHRVAEDVRGPATMRPHVTPDIDEHRGGVAHMVPLPTTWTVAAGESFWSIAEELLAEAWGRVPTDAEIDPFWRALVDANRGRLIDPADPDLVHPGQVFEIPPAPSTAS